MSIAALAGELSGLGLHDSIADRTLHADPVLFQPKGRFDGLCLKEVSRYLFRVYTPFSDGLTDATYAKSRDAYKGLNSAVHDVFSQQDVKEAAAMVNRRLQWTALPHESDNLVSWSSSLLFVLRYIFYRYHRDGCQLEHIKLCIIDTTKFAPGTFIHDMDLIDAFASFNTALRDFKNNLRTKKHKTLSGRWHFGETLSQGLLCIAGKSQTVSASAIIDGGLFMLQPEFEKALSVQTRSWASEVLRLREPFYHQLLEANDLTWQQAHAAIRIANLYGQSWALPMFANLVSLTPRPRNDKVMLQALRGPNFSDDEREDASPSKTKIVHYGTSPEIKQVGDILQCTYTDYCVQSLRVLTGDAEASMRRATRKIMDCRDAIDRSISLPGGGFDTFLNQIAEVEFLCRRLRGLSTDPNFS